MYKVPTSPLYESGEAKPLHGQQVSKLLTRKWLKTIIAVILAVMGSGSLGFAFYHNSLPTPAKTLTAFCAALLDNDDSTAWSQLSPRFQAELTQPLFMSFFNRPSACTLGTPAQNANTATITLMLVFPGRKMTDNVALKQDNNGTWKIENESGISGLIQMLNSFCNAMQKGDYVSAYSLLSHNFQTKMTDKQLPLFLPNTVSCTYSSLVLLYKLFQITFSLSSPSGAIDNNSATLVQESGTWKIDDFTNLPTKALTAFCSDLKSGDYQDAYDETSTAFRGGRPKADFARNFSSVSSCTYDPPSLVNGNLTAKMHFFYKNGSIIPYTSFLVRDSNNARWKIDQIINFPDQVLTQFCTDLTNQDYQDAYNLFTPDAKTQKTLQAFTQNYNNVTRCRSTFPVQTVSQATATISYTLIDNSVAKQEATLIEIDTDNWEIQRLLNF